MANDLQNQNEDNYAQMLPDYGDGGHYSELDYRVGFGRRLGAYLLDFLILTILTLFIILISGKLDGMIAAFREIKVNPQAYVDSVKEIVPISIFLMIIYYSLEILVGASLGKLILGIKIAGDNRKAASYGKLTARFMVKHVYLLFSILMIITSVEILSTFGLLFWLVFAFGCFAVFGSQKKAIQDFTTGTAVYYKEDIINQ